MLTLTNIQKTFGAGTVNEKKALCGVQVLGLSLIHI